MASVLIEGIFIQFPGNEILKTPFDLSCRFVPSSASASAFRGEGPADWVSFYSRSSSNCKSGSGIGIRFKEQERIRYSDRGKEAGRR